MAEATVHYGEIYYWPTSNKFFQVREVGDESSLCGGFTQSYDAAPMTFTIQRLSKKFIQNCELIESIDQFPGAEFDGIAWEIKREEGAP